MIKGIVYWVPPARILTGGRAAEQALTSKRRQGQKWPLAQRTRACWPESSGKNLNAEAGLPVQNNKPGDEGTFAVNSTLW